MKTVALVSFVLAAGCGSMGMHEPSMMWTEEGNEAMQPKRSSWPAVRIDGLDGAHVTMKPGVFGEGLDAVVPFQGNFQPTGDAAMAAYRLDIELDELTARRYGGAVATHLKGKLTVPERFGARGVLLIAPTVCALRALVTGELDQLVIESEVLPTPEMACAHGEHAGEAQRGETCSMPAHHEHHTGCGAHQQRGWGHPSKRQAELTLSVAK